MAAFHGWAVAVLHSIGAPVTQQNMRALQAWQAAEGGSAHFNPLNTTQPAKGASNYNSVGVKNFGSAGQGVQATAKTLLNGHYGSIVGLLRSGKATAEQIGTAVEKSPWGTGGGVLRVLGSGPVKVPGTLPPRPGAAPGPNGAASDPVQALQQKAFQGMMASSLMQPGGMDGGSLMALAMARKQMQATEQHFPGGAKGPVVPAAGGKGGAGINEMFYDPLGGIKNGKEIGAIGHHGDHVHLSLANGRAQLAAIAQAKRMGMHVGEDGLAGGTVHPVHVGDSYHYRKYGKQFGNLREAADISGTPQQMAAYYRWVQHQYG